MINPFWKTIIATAAGGAVPYALSALQSCEASPNLLVTQSVAGAFVAVAALFTKPPSGQKPQPKPTDPPPPTDPGGN